MIFYCRNDDDVFFFIQDQHTDFTLLPSSGDLVVPYSGVTMSYSAQCGFIERKKCSDRIDCLRCLIFCNHSALFFFNQTQPSLLLFKFKSNEPDFHWRCCHKDLTISRSIKFNICYRLCYLYIVQLS